MSSSIIQSAQALTETIALRKHRLLYGWIKSGYITQGEYLEIVNIVFKLDVSKGLI